MTPRAELMFENQIDAAMKLAEILPATVIKNENFLIIAQSLESLPIVLAPNNPECAIACVSETQEIVMVDELVRSFGISLDYVYGQANRLYEEKILKNMYKFRKGELLGNLEKKNVILVDEGCESGLTALTCIKTLVSLNAKAIFYATPVIGSDNADEIAMLVAGIYAVHKIRDFVNVDFYYKEKTLSSAEEIMQILNKCPLYLPFHETNKNKEKINAV